MLLKKVELTGFKSFATKTTVKFLPGITIIVGPNGCGKSNIFDAVRWVLGEQSAKSLRGNRMNDVIFAGSASFKALSYSQVSLIVNNQDRKIPLDFSEISVIRRLFRSGESEYLLNRVPCRLKDIVELFMDTGIGTEAYSVIEQGRVERVINAKPRERRYIFDEAAGISKYKARKEEALRKLVRTEEDLLRIGDIIEEVRHRANSLKRQASKAARYKRLISEQHDLEKCLLILRHQFLAERSAGIEDEYARISDRHAELSAQIASLNAKNEEERTHSEELSGDLSEAQSLLFTRNSEIEKSEHHISLLKERISNADEASAKIKKELEQESANAIEIEATLKNLDAEYKTSEDALALIEKEYEEKKSRFDSLKKSHDEKLKALESERTEASECLSEKSRLSNEARYCEAMRDRLESELEEQESLIEAERGAVSELKTRLEKQEGKLAASDLEINKLKEKYRSETESLQSAEVKLGALRAENEKVVIQLRQAESRLGALLELKQNFEGFEKGVKAVMKAAKNGDVKGISGITAACITLPEKYEQAIESALGPALQSIITTQLDEAERAISYLKHKQAGQADFLPRDIAHLEDTNGHLKAILSQEGVLGLARKFVRADGEHKPLVDALLGDTVVVDTLSTALHLLRNGNRARYVSLNGERVELNGIVSGGSMRKSGIFSRRREEHTLEQKIASLKKVCKQLEDKIANALKEMESCRTKIKTLAEELHKKELGRASLAKDVESTRREYDAKVAALQTSEQKISSQKNELAKLQDTICTNTEGIRNLTHKIGELDASIEKRLAALNADNAAVAELDETVSRLIVEQTRQRERNNALRERLEIAHRSLEVSHNTICKKEEELKSLAAKKSELAESEKLTRKTLQELVREKQEIEKQITYRTQERETLLIELKKLAQELMALQRDYNEVQNTMHELDLKRTQISAQSDSISQQAQEKFNKDIGEIQKEVGKVSDDRDELIRQLADIKEKTDRIGPINAAAIGEYQEAYERYEFLTAQQKDLTEAKASLQKTIGHIDETTTRLFSEAFEKIRRNFIETFRTLFNGGRADLIIVRDEENKEREPGIEIVAQPPGKKLQNISLLSGGEKSLTAIALLFGIFMYKPSPFCLLDEIDAQLDDVNVERFKELIRRFTGTTQFIIATHNKNTMTLADSIYGVTMEEPGVSKLVSVKLENIQESRLVG